MVSKTTCMGSIPIASVPVNCHLRKAFTITHIYLLIGSGGSRWATMRGSSPPTGLFYFFEVISWKKIIAVRVNGTHWKKAYAVMVTVSIGLILDALMIVVNVGRM